MSNRVITVLRKPLVDTVARNVLRYGTGGLNVDASRLPTDDDTSCWVSGARNGISLNASKDGSLTQARINGGHEGGRWPANVILTEAGATGLDEDIGVQVSGVAHGRNAGAGNIYGSGGGLISKEKGSEKLGYGDTGGPSRYFKVVSDE